MIAIGAKLVLTDGFDLKNINFLVSLGWDRLG
jgi:hypothetical protein